MKKKLYILIGVIFVFTIILFLFVNSGSDKTENSDYSFLTLPESPLDATYNIYGTETTLTNGAYEGENERVDVIFEPVYGEMNDDGDADAVLLLKYSNGATTTYHLGVALADDGGFLGLEALELERKDEPLSFLVEDLVVTISYRPQELERSNREEEHYTLTNGLVLMNRTPEDGDTIYRGEYVFGHESRTFSPCSGNEVYWIAPDSLSHAALGAIYEEKTRELEPYTPIYIVLSGRLADAPTEGFGAEYGSAIEVNSILSIPEEGSCIFDE